MPALSVHAPLDLLRKLQLKHRPSPQKPPVLSHKHRVYPEAFLNLFPFLRLPRPLPVVAEMRPKLLSALSLGQRRAQQLLTRSCAANETARRKRRTSARSWTQRTRSRLLWASLRPHHHPSHPCTTHRLLTNQPPRWPDQYTATMTQGLLSLLHRLGRRKCPVCVAKSRSKPRQPATMRPHRPTYRCHDRRLQSLSRSSMHLHGLSRGLTCDRVSVRLVL